MDNRVIKINPSNPKPYPYFAMDRSTNYIWLVTGPGVTRQYVTASFVTGNAHYSPFELSRANLQASSLTKIDRMKLTLQIGSNVE